MKITKRLQKNTDFNYLQKYVNILVVFVQQKCFPLIFTVSNNFYCFVK